LKRLTSVILLLVCLLPVRAAESTAGVAENAPDTITVLTNVNDLHSTGDTATHAPAAYWKPDPAKATWFAVIVPGLGQIYNRSYWKLPIVYGGLMGCLYASTWNGRLYNDYKEAYRDIQLDATLSDDPTRSYNAMLPNGYTIETMGGRSQYTNTLSERMNLYRRYRDLSIAGTMLLYVLTIIDAYVDAQLFDFDISPDLSLNIEPQLYHDLQHQRAAEVKVAITF